MAFVSTQGPTVVDQTTLMKKYLQFVAALTDVNTPDETKLKMMQEVSENFENVTSSQQYSTFLEHIIPRFLTFLQDGEVQFLQEKPAQQLRKLVLEIIHRIPTNEHLRPHTKNILSVMFRFLETENEENVLICLRIIIELHKQFRPPITQEIHHFLDFVKQIYKELPKVVNRYFENPQVIPDNTVPTPEMVGMITTIVVKVNPERDDSETRTHSIIPRGSLSLKVLAELPIIVVLMYQLYKLNIHNVVAEFVPLIMNTIIIQVSTQARQHKLYNKELYADFIAAQIKTLSFLAYIIRIYQELVAKYSQQMVKGMLQLLSNCPAETAHLRKELLIAAKHILTTDLRSQFIPCMDKLFDESILIGSGYTARETLRPLAYSTLADLVHHVRQHLPLNDLSLAVQLFAKNIDDESLPSSIQTMSCKLLLNLVDCIRSKSEQENGNGRDILMRMLEVFVLKFHTIARYQLSVIFKKCKPQSELGAGEAALPSVPAGGNAAPVPVPSPAPTTPVAPAPGPVFEKQGEKEKEDKQTFQVTDCRSLVKTLVCGVKTITWGITSCKAPGEAQFIPNKQLQPKETQIYIKLVKYAMQALDIYQVQIAGNGQTYIRVANCQTVRMKEEKEVLEHFAGVFTMMNALTFKEIFQTTVPYMVERISKNYALQIVANSFLANPTTSALFATILVEYLLDRLPEMGSNVELSNLYLKLFKLVFGSVSLFAAENEQMLKPHLHKIVNSSMELAQTAKEPYNYFLLLRALFRSIGGGSHDLLYQEFLPLLPNLLQGLNMLQSGLHKQHMKDLFVELCLTVPVRLSSLLPYLPMLMDPLVSALNGSQTLVSQGLRTLELCVDNLQPDFLYDHIQPVRAELMQALWRTLRNPAENISHVAYRVLGKFGGSNRKMLKESQKLQYVVTEIQGPSITAEFSDCKASIQLPMEKAIETALDCLKSANTEPYYRRQAWEVIKCFLVAMMSLDDNKHALYQLLAHPNFTEKSIPSVIISHRYKAQDTPARKTFEQALTGAFMSAVIKDLRPSALPFVASLIRHYTMVAVAQQCGPFLLQCYQVGSQPSTAMFHSEENGSKGMDPLVLIDAIAICMAYEEKELCKIGEVALAVIFDVASIILGSKERACQLPLFSYIVERLCACCYEQAWYAKLGGVVSIKFLMERLPLIWVLQNQQTFLKALLFVMMDLTGEVSNGAVAMAKTTLEQLLIRCATPLKDEEKTEDILSAQEKSFHHVTHDLVREVTSPNSTVRKQAMHSLQVLAQVTGKSVTVIMEPHKEVLQDMVPPKKHLLRHQPANAQIGLMEGNTFCTTLQPRLFTMDLNVVEHKVFYTELLNLCEAEDCALMKLPCYKSLPSLVPLRIAALNALAACNYLPQSREKIIAALFKALNSTNNELQEAGEACMRKFLEGATIEVDQIHTHMRPLLMMLGDYRSLTLNVVNRLTSVTRLFPNSFNDKFCDQMMQHLRKWMEVVVITHKGGQRSDGNEMKICSAIINLFHLIPAAPQTLVKPLLEVVMKTERAMLIEAGSPFREPLIKFLTRHPSQTVELFMMEATLNDPQWSRMFMSFLKHKDAKPLRDVLAANPNRFITLLIPVGTQAAVRPGSPSTSTMRLDLQFQAIKIISIIVKNDECWLANQHSLVSQLRRVWVSEAFQERHRKENMAATNWKEPKLLAYCLLNYCKRNYGDIELLFQLLRAFTGRFLCNMTFLKEYMEEEIPKNYTIAQKRALFFRFVDFSDPNFGDELKAKVLQHILNPAFLHSFEKGEGEQLLGPPNPEGDNPESITSVFITKVLDPEKQADMLDSLRIYLLQFATLLVEHAPHHIHDNNKNRNSKLRRLMTFAWPCLLSKACVDPACKYSGHLLLAHIIAKFAIHKKIVLQVFHSLLKAHAMEARAIVRQAMAILTPAVPARMEDGHQMLTHWTRKIIVEEGHTVPQLVHILHLIVQHFKVYYPVRHHLVQHMVSAMQRLGFTPSVTIEQRKLAVDLAEVVIKWELQRIKDQQPDSDMDQGASSEGASSASSAVKRGLSVDSGQEVKRFRTATGAISAVFGRSQSLPGADALLSKPIDKQHTDTVNDNSNTAGSPGELLSRRCVNLLKTALRPDMWPKSELKLQWFDKLLMTVTKYSENNFLTVRAVRQWNGLPWEVRLDGHLPWMSEEANKAFSAAVQMHDVLVKAWAMWGDYLENIFVKERQLHLGVSAITCYLHACRHQNESKSRKYLAKVLWLLSFDDDKNTLADAVDKYCIGVPPIQWLAWIPQLLTCLVGSEGKLLLNLISQVGRVYPQAVYFPIRTLYLTLKIEQRERYKSDSGQQQPSSVGNQSHSASDPGPIRATAPMWRCSRIMHMQRELHPTLLSSLEGIVDQMVWFRENWHEEVLRQLQQGLAKCYSVAFEKSGAVSDAKITPHTLNFVKKLVSTFGVGLENVSNVSTMFSSAASESLARRAQATAQDPVFQKLKGQFTTDFDFSVPGSMKLHNLISKLKKWIKILEAKTKQLPKFFLIEEKCRFLSNFSAQTAEVEIPGEFLMPKPTHYYIKIARFMPRVEIVQKHNTAARRLYIRGHNGKIYPYLVMNDACLTESRREERVLQLLRLLNPCLEKRKETTKRHLFFTVPRVVAVSPQMRLVEDNPSSLSLVEIYKQRCAKKGIEHDSPISRYYDRLATVQARGTQASHQVLRDILKEVQGNMVPRSMLKEWALHTFPNATDYWTFRKMFTIQLALIGFAEFVFHLNRLNPEMLQIAQDTGKLNVAYFRFDINDATGDLDANRPVPFRLTPNISEFLTTIGVSGPLTASMIAVARCFAQPNFKVDGILKTVLRDEIIAWHKKTQEDTSSPLSAAGQPENMDSQQLVSLVQKAVTAIMTRLHNLAQFEGGESKVNTLVAAANSLDNLCRMDPAWHPWL
uniref:Transformation/transcription domain associated protein n=1 Tax=Podarcis muralis TaxID=64176 RepID=A0A670KJU8_PODMU